MLLGTESRFQGQVLRMTLVKSLVLVTVTFLSDSPIKKRESASAKPWHSNLPPCLKNLPKCVATNFYSEVDSGLLSNLAFDMQEKLI